MQLAPEVPEGSFTGELRVVGSGQDFAFVLLEDGEETMAFEVHSSSGFDLSTLSGSDRTLALLGGGVPEHQSLVVLDGAEPLWMADLGDRAAAVSLFTGGPGVTAGETLYTDQDPTWIWQYTSILVATDEGVLELWPGEVQDAVIASRVWRFAAVAAYRRELRDGVEAPACTLKDMLAYELYRVPVGQGLVKRERPAGLPPAELTCD